jgi:hypothetical protein
LGLFIIVSNGGPIILLQVENEYGLVEKDYGPEGHHYIEWAASMALRYKNLLHLQLN